jgi:TrmH family RNA methyltransferase
MKVVSSRHNPLVGRFRTLAETPDPAGTQLLLDGVHLVRDARASGLVFDIVAVSSSSLRADTEEGRLAKTLADAGIEVVEAADEVFDALSPVKTPSGIAAIAARRAVTAAEICAPPDALVLMIVDVQEPGNVGAILRAGEAGGATGAFVCGVSAHPFSWKAIRGSMGSALRLPVATGLSTTDALECFRLADVRTIAAIPRGGEDPDTADWRGKIALILGGEGPGLRMEVLAECDATVSIPMAKTVDSLNVAVAAAVLVYAARRHRQ